MVAAAVVDMVVAVATVATVVGMVAAVAGTVAVAAVATAAVAAGTAAAAVATVAAEVVGTVVTVVGTVEVPVVAVAAGTVAVAAVVATVAVAATAAAAAVAVATAVAGTELNFQYTSSTRPHAALVLVCSVGVEQPRPVAMPLRIAMLHPDLGIGGAERLVVDAAMALVEKVRHVPTNPKLCNTCAQSAPTSHIVCRGTPWTCTRRTTRLSGHFKKRARVPSPSTCTAIGCPGKSQARFTSSSHFSATCG